LTLGAWRAHLLARLRHQIRATGDPQLQELLEELHRYPAPAAEAVTAPAPVVPIRLRTAHGELAFLSTTTLSARRVTSPSRSWRSRPSCPPTTRPPPHCAHPGRRSPPDGRTD
jgi:hypothetical protein